MRVCFTCLSATRAKKGKGGPGSASQKARPGPGSGPGSGPGAGPARARVRARASMAQVLWRLGCGLCSIAALGAKSSSGPIVEGHLTPFSHPTPSGMNSSQLRVEAFAGNGGGGGGEVGCEQAHPDPGVTSK